ncbi:cytosine(34)-C(5)-methyltransferase [Polychytrium aggregatum]|uniref:cytosine(34)-C(5)-methyltransferase n=1 Tax=Polychytrium aggregatum TaxID=110093 RepID=UPI0022FDF04E|nr:cytosine(34)-C(5)-methyltransferase [Polychytrium aggregatum]KAI9197252.1 cytosine(34)-C(5)-methyltransferase [Polychytrium aggregatum]
MGKRHPKSSRGRRKGGRERNAITRGEGSSHYISDFNQNNEKFNTYYKAQGILTEEEWEENMACMKTLLPTNFRFTGSRSHAVELRDLMVKEYFPDIKDFEVDGELIKVPLPTPLPWYPNNLAWQFDCPRNVLRRSPEIGKFHRFLVSETEVGNINRQEAVSMIPVLLLDVKPEHIVLDMCAAPGSKTAQLIEAIHATEEVIPPGLVLANDADYDRSHMLIRQVKRLQSPCLMVTNHDAQCFPYIYFGAKGTNCKSLQFDRILCDVPCSGDGTIRKNKTIWSSWHQNQGMALHKIQVNILQRACELLKIGGNIVYSTCSFNPVENEAVVAELLRRHKGSLELVDISETLPELKRKPGISTWKILCKDDQFYDKFEDVPKENRRNCPESVFPHPDNTTLHLDRCIRLYPYLQNTGGFFVALLKKTGPIGSLDRTDVTADQVLAELDEKEALIKKESEEAGGHGSSKKTKTDDDSEKQAADAAQKPVELDNPKHLDKAWSGKEDPFVFLTPDHTDIVSCGNFYGLDANFPRDRFVVRSETAQHRTIYFVSQSVKNILKAYNSSRLEIVNSGVRMFSRNVGDGGIACPYRLNNEGLYILDPYLNNRTAKACLADILVLLTVDYPKFKEFTPETMKVLETMEQGSFVLRFNPSEEPGYTGSLQLPITLPVWRANVSASLLLNRHERRALMARLTGEEWIESKITGAEKRAKRVERAAGAGAADDEAGDNGEEDGDDGAEDDEDKNGGESDAQEE